MRRSRTTNIFIQIVSLLMLIVAILLGVGTKFFEFDFNLNEQIRLVSFWILLGISTLLTSVMFYSSSSISSSNEFSSNEDYKLKVKNVNKINTMTGLEYAEDFLEDHYIDKKYEKMINKLKNKLEKVKKKADRRGFNFVNPSRQIFKPIKWYRWFNGRFVFNRLLERYNKLKDRISNPELREEMKYTYIRGIFRVTKSYLSDGIKKYKFNADPDKPTSGISIMAGKGLQRLATSLVIVLFGSNMAITIIDQGFTNVFWIDLGMKLLSYMITIIFGYMFGKTYFAEVFLDLEIKRENLLQKYIIWLKRNHSDVWNESLSRMRTAEQDEADAKRRAEAEQKRIEENAKVFEASMRNT